MMLHLRPPRTTRPESTCGVRVCPGPAVLLTLVLLVTLGFAAFAAGCGSPDVSTTTVPTTEAPTTTMSTTATSVPTSSSSTTAPPTTSSEATTSMQPARVDKITLVAPPGPMAIPMAYIAENDLLSAVAEETDVVVWENSDQLKAYVAGQQGDFVTMPSNNSAIFYNKGLRLQLLDISVWNITYLISTDARAASFADIRGDTVAIAFEGSVPDLMFQYITRASGLDPQKDFKVRYTTDPTQAAQLLLSGQVDNAILGEALATAVTLQTKDTDRPLHRALAFDKAWTDSSGGDSPIAGTVATGSILDRPDVIVAFKDAYRTAVRWMLDHPEEAGELVETKLPQLGLTASVMTASLKNITWRWTSSVDARPSLDAFYQSLSELSPDVIGGKVPDDGFYFDQS